jgi:hypothetical protein
MNAIIRVAMLLAVGTSVATAAEPQVRVAASRELKLAVIDSSKASATREAMHQAFATGLGAALSRRCGGHVGVRAKCVGADHAAFNLGAGVYDAVLVVGRGVPDAFRRVDGITLSAQLEQNRRDRGLYFVIANGDAALQEMLAAAFAGALSDEKFLQSFAGSDGKLAAPTGEKVAAQ